MKKLIFIVSFLCVFGAEAKLKAMHRGIVTEEEPKIKKNMDEFQKLCGCTPKSTVDWEKLSQTTENEEWVGRTLQTAKDCLVQLNYAVGQQGKLCTKYKKEVCSSIKNIVITGNGPKAEASTKLDKGTLTLTVSGGASGCEGNGSMASTIEKNLE